MDFDTKHRSKVKSTKIPFERKQSATHSRIPVDGASPQHFFHNSLKGLAQLLCRDICNNVTHYDCMMKIEVSANDNKGLLVAFLTKVLVLTHMHQTIFCSMQVEECTDKKLVANLFGVWFDHFDKEVKSVLPHRCRMEKNEDFSCNGFMAFEFNDTVL